MTDRLQILMVEDNPFDSELIKAELMESGLVADFSIVADEPSFRRALEIAPDLVLADYNLPSLDLFDVLEVMKDRHPGRPVIVVTGHVGDELAAECIKRGAVDYVLKDRMGRLPQAIDVALQNRMLKEETTRAQAELHASEALFRGAFDAARTGIALIAADSVTYVDVNQALCSMLGYTKSELMELDWVTITYPDDRMLNLEQVAGLLGGTQEVAQVTKRYVRKDGRVIYVEVSDALVRGPAEEALYFVTHVTEVTERFEAERALRESQGLLQAVVNNSPAMIHIKDPTGAFVLVNEGKAAFSGLSPDQMVGKTVFDLFSPEFAQAIADADAEVLRSLAPVEVEEVMPDVHGRLRSFLSLRFPLFDEAGACYALCGICTDITDRAKAEADKHRLQSQLRQAQKMEAVGQLAGGIAHDFNNLLAVILNYAEFVRDDTPADDPRRADVQEIIMASERAASLVHQLLAFSRKEVLSPQVVDPLEVVRGMRELVTRSIGEDISLIIRETSSDGLVEVDPGQLEQIVLNLAVNSRDAMPDGGVLTIGTRLEVLEQGDRPGLDAGPYVALCISDTGHGMDPDTADRVFEPFFTTKPRGEGTGLGLATVYGIAKQSGGGVYVESVIDAGTSFTIYLPLCTDNPAAAPAARSTEVTESGSASVLVVEDEDAVRELVARILTKNGFDVIAVESGPMAVEHCTSSSEPIDLLLTDVVMPLMSGRALADELGVLRPGVKTLFMSGYTDEIVAQRGLLDGDVHLLRKPFNAKTLLDSIRSVLNEAA